MGEYKVYLKQLEQAQTGTENAIRTYLQLIPGFGGALNQAIFGTHDIMKIKRLEKFAAMPTLGRPTTKASVYIFKIDRKNVLFFSFL